MNETLAEVISAHAWQRTVIRSGPSMECSCGIWVDDMEPHLATAVLAWVEARLAGAREDVAEAISDEWLDGGHGLGCVHRDEPHDVTAGRSTDAALVVVSRALGVEVGS